MANAPFLDGSNTGTVSLDLVPATTNIPTAGTNKLLVIGSAILVEDVIVEIAGTNVTGGTLLQVVKTDTTGNPLIFSHATSALTANTTFDLSTATTKNRSVCAAWTYIAVKATGSAVTDWPLRITIKYRKLQENSKVQAV